MSHIFLVFTPNLGEDEPILTSIFSDGWVETTNQILVATFIQRIDGFTPCQGANSQEVMICPQIRLPKPTKKPKMNKSD